jgi:hypothetical protein
MFFTNINIWITAICKIIHLTYSARIQNISTHTFHCLKASAVCSVHTEIIIVENGKVVHKYVYIAQYSVEFLFRRFSGWMSVWVKVYTRMFTTLQSFDAWMKEYVTSAIDVYQKVYNGKKIFTSHKNYLGPLRMSMLSWVLPYLTWGYLFFSHKNYLVWNQLS